MSKNKTKIQFRRLAKLAEHLESGQLGHKRFDFDTYHSGKKTRRHCGTAGCAIGECPTAFKDEWVFLDGVIPGLAKGGTGYISLDTEKFFGLNCDERRHLFIPGLQFPNLFGGVYLDIRATREQVAANIRAFIKKFKSNK